MILLTSALNFFFFILVLEFSFSQLTYLIKTSSQSLVKVIVEIRKASHFSCVKIFVAHFGILVLCDINIVACTRLVHVLHGSLPHLACFLLESVLRRL